MKNPRNTLVLIASIALALASATASRAAGQSPSVTPAPAASKAQTDAEVTALLSTGQWWFKGQNWGNFRTFHADGTFHARRADGTWKISGGMVLLNFPDHVDKLILPIDPKGTKGIDANGLPLMAIQTPVDAPPPTPAPVIASNFASVDPRIKAMLTQGQWYFQGMNWANVREFKADGTFSTQRNAGESGTWTVDNGEVVLTYSSSAQDKILLPLNPRGSKGSDSKGMRMLAIQQPLVEPTPDPVPPQEITPAMLQAGKASTQTPMQVAEILTQGQWWFQGGSWANVRVFKQNGTFKGGGDGTWKFADGMVIIDSQGRQDNFILPVDPNGTNGVDSKGNPMIARRQPLKAPPAKMAGVMTANRSAQSDEEITSILTHGQWYFQGLSWANTRVFKADGTFYTQRRPGEGGTWKIIDGWVVLVFKSSENLLQLPIAQEFTIGQDSEGVPIIVLQQALSEPEPTAPPPHIVANRTPRPASGNTPPPFGTAQPGGPPAATPPPFGTAHPPDDSGGPPAPTPPPFGTTQPPVNFPGGNGN